MKKSFTDSVLCRLSFAVAHELLKLPQVESATAAQLHQRIRYQPETGFPLIRRCKILKGSGVKHDGPEAFHSSLSGTRQHRVAGASKQRNTETALIVQGKPISVGTSHGEQSRHHLRSIIRTAASAPIEVVLCEEHRHFNSHAQTSTGSRAPRFFWLDFGLKMDIRISWYWSSLKNKQTAQGEESGKQILMSRVNFRKNNYTLNITHPGSIISRSVEQLNTH